MKRVWTILMTLCVCLSMGLSVTAERYVDPSGDEDVVLPTAAQASALSVNAKSAVLMDMASGKVLFEQNSHESLPIASVTKVMTLRLNRSPKSLKCPIILPRYSKEMPRRKYIASTI